MGAKRTRARRAPPHQRTPIERTFKARGAHRNAHTLDIHSEPAQPGESGGEVTATIYMGVVHNATEAILTSHLLRNWLRVKADYLQGILIDAWSVGDVQAGELRGSLRTVPGETFAVQLVRGYLYASLTLQGDTGWLGWVELTQYRTDEVQVFVWDQPESEATPRLWPAGTLGADLVDWLDQHYDGHGVTPLELTPDEQEEFDQADAADKPRVVEQVRNKRGRDPHNQRAIDRLEGGELEWEVRGDWRGAFFLAKGKYPADMESGEDTLWRKNVQKYVDRHKANENRIRRENSAEK